MLLRFWVPVLESYVRNRQMWYCPSANCRGDGRHNGGDLIGFCDGHAKWYTMTELKVDYPATRIYYYPPRAVTMVEAGWWILPQAFD